MTTAPAEQQKIVEGFQKLREQQQQMVTEMTRLETELRENQLAFKRIFHFI